MLPDAEDSKRRRYVFPPFEEAVKSFSEFLQSQDASPNLVWIFREDVTSVRRKIWCRRYVASDDMKFASKIYELGLRKNLGIALEAFCAMGSSTACYVWFPDDEEHASSAMFTRSLHFKIPVPLISATEIGSRIHWRLRQALNSHEDHCDLWVKELPTRPNLPGKIQER